MTYKYKGIYISNILQGTATNILDNSSNSIVLYNNFPGNNYNKTITISGSGNNITSNLSDLENDIYKPYDLRYRIPVFLNGTLYDTRDASILRVAAYTDYTTSGLLTLPTGFPTSNVMFKAILIGPGGSGGGGGAGKNNDSDGDNAGSGGGSGGYSQHQVTQILTYDILSYKYEITIGSPGDPGYGGVRQSDDDTGNGGGNAKEGSNTTFVVRKRTASPNAAPLFYQLTALAGKPGYGAGGTGNAGGQPGKGGSPYVDSVPDSAGNPGKIGQTKNNSAKGGDGGATKSKVVTSNGGISITGYGSGGAGGKGGNAWLDERSGSAGTKGEGGLVRVIFYFS